MSIVSLLIVAIVIAALAKAISGSLGPVSRHRVAKFARRQTLVITPDNGNAVIAYLATTRRWRAAGLTAGVIVSIIWSVSNGFSIGMVQLIAGWFAGAVIAEWRISRLPVGTQRAASLQPRVPEVYVSTVARAVPLVFAGAAIAVAAIGVAANVSGRAVASAQLVGLAVLATSLVAVGRLVERRILDRPQPLAPADVLAADDAIRSRSLRVLVGAIGTLTAYCVVAQLGFLSPGFTGAGTHASMTSAQVALWLLGTLFGRAMGTSPWSARPQAADVPVA